MDGYLPVYIYEGRRKTAYNLVVDACGIQSEIEGIFFNLIFTKKQPIFLDKIGE